MVEQPMAVVVVLLLLVVLRHRVRRGALELHLPFLAHL